MRLSRYIDAPIWLNFFYAILFGRRPIFEQGGLSFPSRHRLSAPQAADAIRGPCAGLIRRGVALLKIAGQTIQIHKPAVPTIHIPHLAQLTQSPDIVRGQPVKLGGLLHGSHVRHGRPTRTASPIGQHPFPESSSRLSTGTPSACATRCTVFALQDLPPRMAETVARDTHALLASSSVRISRRVISATSFTRSTLIFFQLLL